MYERATYLSSYRQHPKTLVSALLLHAAGQRGLLSVSNATIAGNNYSYTYTVRRAAWFY